MNTITKMIENLNVLATLMLLIPLALFMLFYSIKSSWQASRLGRTLMAAISAVFAFTIWLNVAFWLPASATLEAVRLVILLLANISFWGLFLTLRTLQKEAKQEIKSNKEKNNA